MADMLTLQISRLVKSENDRKSFIAGITHDLRNPLSIVGGYSETLIIKAREGLLTEKNQQEYLKLIFMKVQKITKMVEQLHQLSKIEAPDFEPVKEPFMFSELLQQVVQPLLELAEEKGLNINCDSCQDEAYLKGI